MGHDVRIKVVFDYECPLLEPRILTNPHMIQTGHIWFFQLAVCFWVLGLPLLVGIDFFWVQESNTEFGNATPTSPATTTALSCWGKGQPFKNPTYEEYDAFDDVTLGSCEQLLLFSIYHEEFYWLLGRFLRKGVFTFKTGSKRDRAT